MVLADNPAIEARLRTDVEEDQRNPQATPRVFLAISEMRRTIVGPTLAAADDASALAVMKARADLVAYLEKTDLAACRQFSGDGIRDINKLDSEGQTLFRTMLTAMEAAYRSGKANGGKGKSASNEEFAAMLRTAGFTPDDFAKFSQTATLKDDELLQARVPDRRRPEQAARRQARRLRPLRDRALRRPTVPPVPRSGETASMPMAALLLGARHSSDASCGAASSP